MKVGIYSLGCKVNLYESEFITDLLKNNGFEIVDFDDEADIYIINTCTVTNESDRKSRKIISKARRNNEEAIIVAMGCYSQINPDNVEADIVIGNKDKSKIVELINEYLKSREKINKHYDLRHQEFEPMEISKFENHTRAFVKIQDGCNAFCSYCIIPYSRGNIRSKKFNDVIKEVTNLVNNGYKEIVLTGIHTGKYGIDIGTNLEELLKELIKIKGIYRIRLSSIEINEITDGILELMKNSDIIANHLHIPIQSGSDKILKLMNRRYTVTQFKKRIEDIRKIRNDIAITTDLIVGFPGEDEPDFLDTINTLKEINFVKIHTFPYSKRNGTKASLMDNQVDGIVKKARVKKVLELSMEQEEAYYKKFIGKEVEVLTEVNKDSTIIGHTSNFVPVEITDKIANNEIVTVKVIGIEKELLKGKIISK